jgi:hypothetical protein
MSIFGKILEKLGLRKESSTTAPPRTQAGTTASSAPIPTPTPAEVTAEATRPAQPVPISEADVVARLEQLAAANPQKLNWRTSIVDLMKLLGMESSLAERRELATELGYTGDMKDTAQMNIWLHKQVLRKIAENGGNVPKELLD